MVPLCSHCLHSIPYIQQRGLTTISLYSQTVTADPLAYLLTHTVAYTQHLALTVAYTQHIHTDIVIYTYTYTITSSGAYMHIWVYITIIYM